MSKNKKRESIHLSASAQVICEQISQTSQECCIMREQCSEGIREKTREGTESKSRRGSQKEGRQKAEEIKYTREDESDLSALSSSVFFQPPSLIIKEIHTKPWLQQTESTGLHSNHPRLPPSACLLGSSVSSPTLLLVGSNHADRFDGLCPRLDTSETTYVRYLPPPKHNGGEWRSYCAAYNIGKWPL